VVASVNSVTALGSSDALFASDSPQAEVNGIAVFSATPSAAPTRYVYASDGTLSSGISAGIPVVPPVGAFILTAPASATSVTAFSVTVTAKDTNGNPLTGYGGTVHFTSTDSAATLPAGYTFLAADTGIHTFSVTLKSAGSQTITVTDTNSAVTATSKAIAAAVPATYHAINPARLVDTRINLGISGPLSANTPASFPAWNYGGVPAGATAVTGNLTVAGSTAGWAIFLGPVANAAPTSSTLNFVTDQIVANSLTVALSPTGAIWASKSAGSLFEKPVTLFEALLFSG